MKLTYILVIIRLFWSILAQIFALSFVQCHAAKHSTFRHVLMFDFVFSVGVVVHEL